MNRPLRRQTLREQMNLGLKAKVLFRELSDLAVLFRELLLLARTYSSGRCWNGADQFFLTRWRSLSARKTHVN
jgi:hypothetical protein